jgi:hypothetical protein
MPSKEALIIKGNEAETDSLEKKAATLDVIRSNGSEISDDILAEERNSLAKEVQAAVEHEIKHR